MKLREAIKETRQAGGVFIARQGNYDSTSRRADVLMVTRYQIRILNADLTKKIKRTQFSPTADDLIADDWIPVKRPEWVKTMGIDEAVKQAMANDCCIIRLSNFLERGAEMSVIKPTNSGSHCILKYIRDGKQDDCPFWNPYTEDLLATDWMLINGPEERYSPEQLAMLHEADERPGDDRSAYIEAYDLP